MTIILLSTMTVGDAITSGKAGLSQAGQLLSNTNLIGFSHILLLVLGGIGLSVAIFAVFAVIISMRNYKDTPIKDRLRMLKERDAYQRRGNSGAFDELTETLLTFSKPIANLFYGQNLKLQKQIKQLLTEAGLPDTEARVADFLVKRAATGLVIGVVGMFLVFVISRGTIAPAVFALLGGFFVGSLLPQLQLGGKAKKRKTEIRFKMPDTLDLMVVCVEAGLGLDATFQRVAEETERMAPEIAYELKRLNKELSAGISRIEAFSALGSRAGVDELRSLCSMIIQADKMGVSISDTLRVYADDLRVKRRQKAEELASKASIKMTFPLVLFIFPPLFIILIGPVVINALKSFYPSN